MDLVFTRSWTGLIHCRPPQNCPQCIQVQWEFAKLQPSRDTAAMADLDWSDLRYALAIGQGGSLAAAARQDQHSAQNNECALHESSSPVRSADVRSNQPGARDGGGVGAHPEAAGGGFS